MKRRRRPRRARRARGDREELCRGGSSKFRLYIRCLGFGKLGV